VMDRATLPVSLSSAFAVFWKWALHRDMPKARCRSKEERKLPAKKTVSLSVLPCRVGTPRKHKK
jgi:hypothetical protein